MQNSETSTSLAEPLHQKLRDYQYEAQRHFWASPARGSLWGLQQGLGKTLASLDLYMQLRSFGIAKKMLIIAPLRVAKMSWPEEILKWYPELKYAVLHGTNKKLAYSLLHKDVWIINYEGLQSFKKDPAMRDAMGEFASQALLVIDESSMIRNTSNRTKATQQIAHIAEKVLLLSGTPAPKSVENLYHQIKCIDGGYRMGHTLTQFRQSFGIATSNGFSQVWKYDEGNKDVIYDAIGDVMLSMNTRDYLDLPPVTHVKKLFKFGDKIREGYDKFEESMVLDIVGTEATPFNAGALSMKCRQYCSGFVYDEDLLGERTALHIHKHKIEQLDLVLDSCEEEPVFILYNFAHERDMLVAHLPNAVVLDQDPETINRWNRGEIPMLLANPQSAAHGLNLQKGGHICIWFSLTFDLELFLQANARLDRSGQIHPVIIYYLMAEDSVEERVWKALQSKDTDQKAILAAVAA